MIPLDEWRPHQSNAKSVIPELQSHGDNYVCPVYMSMCPVVCAVKLMDHSQCMVCAVKVLYLLLMRICLKLEIYLLCELTTSTLQGSSLFCFIIQLSVNKSFLLYCKNFEDVFVF